jgi:hypothetical protein
MFRREERQQMTSNGKRPPSVLIPGAQKTPDQIRAEKLDRVEGLLTGKVVPPNDYVKYIVGQLQDVRKKADAASQRLASAKAAVQELETEVIRLGGVGNQYLADLVVWDRPEAVAIEEPPEESENAQATN